MIFVFFLFRICWSQLQILLKRKICSQMRKIPLKRFYFFPSNIPHRLTSITNISVLVYLHLQFRNIFSSKSNYYCNFNYMYLLKNDSLRIAIILPFNFIFQLHKPTIIFFNFSTREFNLFSDLVKQRNSTPKNYWNNKNHHILHKIFFEKRFNKL